jgi:hypothetical protein
VRGAAWIVCLSLASPALADEDPTTAAAMFKAASAAFSRGEYRAAATAFEEADRRAPRAAAIYNAALAWDEAHENARAADDYALALERKDIAAASASRARERLTILAKSLVVAEVVAPGATIAIGHARRPAPTKVYLAPGEYTVTAIWPDGHQDSKKVSLESSQTIAFDPPPPPAVVVEKPIEKPRPVVTVSHAQQNVGIVMLATGVVGAGAAVYLGVRALSARDEFYASGHTDRDARDRAASLRTWTNVAWVSAGVLGAAGAILIVTAPRANVAVGLGEIRVAWTF